MIGAATAIVGASTAITLVAGPLYAYATSAARDLTLRTPYINAVLVDGERGEGESAEVAGTEGSDGSEGSGSEGSGSESETGSGSQGQEDDDE